MNYRAYMIAALWIVLCVAGFGFKQCSKKVNTSNLTAAMAPTGVTQHTALGTIIKSSVTVPQELLDAVDEATTKLQADATKVGYTNIIRADSYTVTFHSDCVLSPVSRTLSFIVDAPNYDGTEYDIDPRPGIGRVYAAELVDTFPNGDISTSIHVCNGPVELVMNTVRYGEEHITLFYNDKQRYEETKTHSNGEGHPLIREY